MSVKKLREQFLADSVPVMDEIRARTLGLQSKFPAADGGFLVKYWDLYADMIRTADDPIPLDKLPQDTKERVDHILNQVAKGELTPAEAKKLMTLIQTGVDVAELPNLVKALEAVESKAGKRRLL